MACFAPGHEHNEGDQRQRGDADDRLNAPGSKRIFFGYGRPPLSG
jgi:hypothetical protein